MPSPSTRRWSYRILFALVLAFFLIIIGGAITWRMGKSRLAEAFAEADRLDPGWRQDESISKSLRASLIVDAQFQNVYLVTGQLNDLDWPKWPFPELKSDPEYLRQARDNMTASLLPERAQGLLKDGNWTTARNANRLARLLNDEQIRVLTSQLNLIHPQLEQARKQAELPTELLDAGQMQIGLGLVRRMLDALKYDAILRAHQGDLDGAIRNVRAMLRVSRWPGIEGPIDPGQGFQMVTDDTLISLERILGLGSLKEMELCQLQILLTQHEKTSPLLFWLRDSRAKVDRRYEDIQSGKISFATFRNEELAKSKSKYGAPIAECNVLYSYLSIAVRRATDLHLMNEAVELSKLPADQQMQASFELCSRYPDSPACRLLQPSIGLVDACLHHFIMLRCAIAVLAAERFRLAQGRWPACWEEMIPKYLPAVPLDPFDGKPLRLSAGKGLFVVFAPGELEHRRAKNLPTDPNSDPEDYGFRIFDPDRRRQPPQPFVLPPRNPKPPTKGKVVKDRN